MRTLKDVLVGARSRIEHPDHFHQGGLYGRNNKGEPCYCAAGAALAEANDLERWNSLASEAWKALDRAATATTNGQFLTVASVNDGLGHAAVLQAYDYAITAAEPAFC